MELLDNRWVFASLEPEDMLPEEMVVPFSQRKLKLFQRFHPLMLSATFAGFPTPEQKPVVLPPEHSEDIEQEIDWILPFWYLFQSLYLNPTSPDLLRIDALQGSPAYLRRDYQYVILVRWGLDSIYLDGNPEELFTPWYYGRRLVGWQYHPPKVVLKDAHAVAVVHHVPVDVGGGLAHQAAQIDAWWEDACRAMRLKAGDRVAVYCYPDFVKTMMRRAHWHQLHSTALAPLYATGQFLPMPEIINCLYEGLAYRLGDLP